MYGACTRSMKVPAMQAGVQTRGPPARPASSACHNKRPHVAAISAIGNLNRRPQTTCIRPETTCIRPEATSIRPEATFISDRRQIPSDQRQPQSDRELDQDNSHLSKIPSMRPLMWLRGLQHPPSTLFPSITQAASDPPCPSTYLIPLHHELCLGALYPPSTLFPTISLFHCPPFNAPQ